MITDTPKLMTQPEVAERLRISLRTVEREVAEGRLRSVKLGSRRLVDPRDLEAYLEARKAVAS